MSKKNSHFQPTVGFGLFHPRLSEEMGKEFRDFCAEHYLTPNRVAAKILSDFLIENGISVCQPLPAIEALERFNQEPEPEPDSEPTIT